MGENQRIVFTNNLNRYMKQRGIEQTDIVAALKVSTSTVSDWVTGKKYPRVDAMQRLADFLGVLLSDLTAENDGSASDDDEFVQIREDFRRNPELRTIHSLTRNATKQELKQLEAFIRAIRSGNEDNP